MPKKRLQIAINFLKYNLKQCFRHTVSSLFTTLILYGTRSPATEGNRTDVCFLSAISVGIPGVEITKGCVLEHA